MTPSPDIIRDFARLQAECRALGESNGHFAQENARLREALQRIATQHPINDEPVARAHSLRAHRALAPGCTCGRCVLSNDIFTNSANPKP